MDLSKIIGIAFIGLTLNGFAQRSSGDTLKSDDVFIIKEFQPKISDAFKLSNNPRIVDTIIKIEPKSNYAVAPKRAETSFTTDTIRPAIMKGEPLNKLYRAYVLGGIGNNLTTRGELVLNSTRSKKWDWGLHAWHHASDGGLEDYGNSRFSDNRFNAYGQKFFFNKILSADMKYDLNSLHRYGFNPNSYPTVVNEEFLSKDAISQRYQNIEPSVRLKSYYKDSNNINFDTKILFSSYSDKYESIENNTKFNLKLDRYFGEEFVTAEVKLDLNQYEALDPSKGVPIAQENTIFGFKPGIVTGGEDWLLRAAVELDFSSGLASSAFFFPDLYAKYNLVDDILVPFAGINGGLERNSYKNLTRNNPFAKSYITINNRNVKYNVYGGIRGNYSATTSFNAQVAYRSIENMPFFISKIDSISGTINTISNQFDVIYDNGTMLQLTGEIGYQRINKLSLLFRADYFVYAIENQAKAWNMPDYKLSINANYDIGDKIVLSGDVFLVSDRTSLYVNDATNLEITNHLGAFVDANLGVEYFLTKRWSAFLRINNLANANYQYWNEYSVQGFTLIGGMTYSFWGNKGKSN
ncbi:MAG: TonB-dependent receptor [Flavobacteriales bacterium]|nr:TonB-dependent receptor [Flavobacteriales bacterium]